jgi:hypothetical protein
MTPRVSRIRIFCLITLGGMSALLGAENWSSFHTILVSKYGNQVIPEEYRKYYTSPSSNSLPHICSGILYYNAPDLGTIPIGGFDLANGFVSYSYFLKPAEAYTANTGEGTNPSNIGVYSWEVYYDYNNEGTLGTQTDGTIVNRAKLLDATKYSITNFTLCDQPQPPGTFEFQMIDPTVFLHIGAIDVNRVGTTNLVTLSVSTAATAQGVLSLQYKDALTNSTWQFLSSHAIPSLGAIVPVTETNAVPSRFYRALAPE